MLLVSRALVEASIRGDDLIDTMKYRKRDFAIAQRSVYSPQRGEIYIAES